MEIYNNGNIVFDIGSVFLTEDYVNFVIKLKSYKFSGEHNFCVLKTGLKDVVKRLKDMYNCMDGEVVIQDYDSESFINFKFDKCKVLFCGQFGSEIDENVWKFKQQIDQTIIELLVVNLSNLL